MSATTRSPFDAARDEPSRLVLAIGHEVGNWVGAIRLCADLVDEDLSAVELAGSVVEIDDLSARISSLLALMRPLLSEPAQGLRCTPEAVMVAAADALDAYGGRGVAIDVASGQGLPAVAAAPEVLHHLVASFSYYAVEEARPSGQVRLDAKLEGGEVAFRVVDTGPADEALSDWKTGTPRGRSLLCAVAARIVEALGGRLEVGRRSGGETHVSLRVPLVQG